MEIKEYILFAKKLSVLVLTVGILLAASSARAANNGVGEKITVGSLEYTITVAAGTKNGEVTLSSGGSATGAVTIPKTVTDNGRVYNVTAVGDKAFEMNMNITALTFEGASDGTSKLESIGEYAFSECYDLTGDIVVPASVKIIEKYAFSFNSITGVTFAVRTDGTSSLESVGQSTFEACPNLTGDIVIPASVKTIGGKAFDASEITSLTFAGASDGTSKLESIGEDAFIGCSDLTGDIVIPASVKTIGGGAFAQSSIHGVTFAGAMDGTSKLETIGIDAFGTGNLTGDITIPASVKIIESGAFGYSGITGLTFAVRTDGTSSLETIGPIAFGYCALLTGDITIPAGVKTIEGSAFLDSGITGVVIPGSVNEIQDGAFKNTALGEVVFKGVAPTFGTDVFKDVAGTLVIKVPTQYLDSYKAALPGYAGSIVGAEPDVYTASVSKVEFEKGKATAIEITSSAPAQLFMGVEVNGAALAAENYTVKQGSTILTLSQAYLNGLDVGDYAVKLLFDYGSAETSFKVKAAATTESTTTEQTTGQTTESTQSTQSTESTQSTDPTKPGTDTTKPSGQSTVPTPSASTAETAESEDISPKTGDYSRLWAVIAVMAASGGMLTFLFKVKGKVN